MLKRNRQESVVEQLLFEVRRLNIRSFFFFGVLVFHVVDKFTSFLECCPLKKQFQMTASSSGSSYSIQETHFLCHKMEIFLFYQVSWDRWSLFGKVL